MPLHNAVDHLPQVLGSLQLGPEWELVIVDDGSQDGSLELAQSLQPRAQFLRHETPLGPAEARNRGVEVVQADIVVFLDSDVVACSTALNRLANFLAERQDLAAVFGSYDQEPAVQTGVSRFRNLLHHYHHNQSAGAVASFWSGFGAVRKGCFELLGGFDSQTYPQPSVEDIDLGARLWRAGFKTWLEPSIQVTHLKGWTLSGFMRTDILQRAKPWTRMILEGRAPTNVLNVGAKARLPILLLGLLCLALCLCLALGQGFWLPASLGVFYLASNFGIYGFMARHGLGAPSIVYLALHHLCALLGATLAVLEHFRRR